MTKSIVIFNELEKCLDLLNVFKDKSVFLSESLLILPSKEKITPDQQQLLNLPINSLFRSEKIDTHGGSIRIYIKKDKKVKIETSVKKMLKEEENFGIKDYQTYKKFGEMVYKIRENVLNNLKNLKKRNKKIIGYGAPAKATTALNFFGISTDIDFIVEDNKLKHNKFVPGVKIPIKNKSAIKNKKNALLVLAWNFYKDIKKNNSDLSDKFVNIKELETNNWKQDF